MNVVDLADLFIIHTILLQSDIMYAVVVSLVNFGKIMNSIELNT